MSNRWVQLAAGILAMVAVANFQYGWTFFVNPLQEAHHWTKEAIQVAFTLFVLAETWLVPIEAYLADRFGPRRVLLAGGALAALSWGLNAVAGSLPMLYVAQVLGGCGAGMVYGTSIGNVGRNSHYGPGYIQNNASLFKIFTLRESWQLEARIDAYQLSNSPQFNSPSSSITSGTFGQVTSTIGSGTGINGIGGGRTLQLSATFRF